MPQGQDDNRSWTSSMPRMWETATKKVSQHGVSFDIMN
jgi:hypothetical protein